MRISLFGPGAGRTGGIASHVEALRSRLEDAGDDSRVFDYSIATTGGLLPGIARFVWLMAAAVLHASGRGGLLHVHLASAREFPRVAPFFVMAARLTPLLITFHGGKFPELVRALSPIRRRLLRSAVRASKAVIAVNEEIRAAIISGLSIDADSVVVISPYIRVSTKNEQPAAKVKEVDTVLASGFGNPLYGWIEFVRAAKEANVARASLVMYGERDPAYIDLVEREIAHDERFCIRPGMSRAAFAELLGQTSVFVRPTRADGDSLSVREAQAAGCAVLCSDVVPRPLGCFTFRLDDSDSFAGSLKHALAVARSGGGAVESADDSFPEIERLYMRVSGSRVGASRR